MDTNTFADWLAARLRQKGWSQKQLAQATGLSRQTISNYLVGRITKPDESSCNALARVFGVTPEDVFRAAGILPNMNENPPGIEEWIYLYMHAEEEERQEMLYYARVGKQRRTVTG